MALVVIVVLVFLQGCSDRRDPVSLVGTFAVEMAALGFSINNLTRGRRHRG